MEFFRVVRAIILSAGQVRDLLQRGFVHVHRHTLIADLLPAHKHRHGRRALFADADGVNFHAESRRRVRRHERLDFAGVILSVGCQNDDFAFSLQIAQPVDRRRQRVADGRGVGIDCADAEARKVCLQIIVVKRQRRGDKRLCCEYHQSDAVVRTLVNEILQHRLGHVDAVHAFAIHDKILGDHAAGQVQRRHNVNAARFDFRCAFGQPRLRQRKNEQREHQPAQRR